jgi:molybdopterin-guanine dinucleotide biosynthesis protein A
VITLGYFGVSERLSDRATRTSASIWPVDVFWEIELCIIGEMDGVNGFVLAGGQSSRMGTDKALLDLNGRTLLERAMDTLSKVAGGVWILGSRERFEAFGNVIEDEFPGHGPLGGIHAALRASHQGLNVILAVDMPFVEVQFLEYLAEQAVRSAAAVTIPRAGGGWQPLCAVYRRAFAEVAEPALRAGRNKIDPLFGKVSLRTVEEVEMKQQGFALEMFRNLNTPEDMSAAQFG